MNLPKFKQFPFTVGATTRTVYHQGTGPAVILMHELPGMIPQCVELAEHIASQGFTVFLPLLFGEPNQPFTVPTTLINVARICLGKEFYCFAKNQSSPITNWLKALCREAKQLCNGQGVGVIGMCLTGGFVLSLMADESVLAPVASQPSLPISISPSHKAALGISPDDLATAKVRTEEGVRLLALRFSEDSTCPAARFATLRREFGDKVETIEIDSSRGNKHNIPKMAHSVLTVHFVDSPDHPTYQARERVLSFLKEHLEN
jgi:dienelactone hydrolase